MTALAYNTDPALDFFDDEQILAPRRPQLRLIEGQGYGDVVSAARPTVPAASVEVYRRRRFLALVAVTVLVLGIAWATGMSVLSFDGVTAAPAADNAPAVHVVLPGDTYAAIAADLGVSNPVAAGDMLRAANGGSDLIVGQRLVVDVATLNLAG